MSLCPFHYQVSPKEGAGFVEQYKPQQYNPEEYNSAACPPSTA